MKLNVGILLKNIREDIFNYSIRTFSEKINMHYTTYHNYEKNNLGKNPLKLINELSYIVSKLLYKQITYSTNSKELLFQLLEKNLKNYLKNYDYIINKKNLSIDELNTYIHSIFIIVFSIEKSLKEITTQNKYHKQTYYCINKIINLIPLDEILIVSNSQNYLHHLQIAYDNPTKIINSLITNIDDVNNSINTLNLKNHNIHYTNINKYLKNFKKPQIIIFYHYLNNKLPKLLYNKIAKNSYLCVVDNIYYNSKNEISFQKRCKYLLEEIYLKEFWTTLTKIDNNSIKYLNDYAKLQQNLESNFLNNLINRINNYPMTFDEIKKIFTGLGFKIILNKRTNAFIEGLSLFKK